MFLDHVLIIFPSLYNENGEELISSGSFM